MRCKKCAKTFRTPPQAMREKHKFVQIVQRPIFPHVVK